MVAVRQLPVYPLLNPLRWQLVSLFRLRSLISTSKLWIRMVSPCLTFLFTWKCRMGLFLR